MDHGILFSVSLISVLILLINLVRRKNNEKINIVAGLLAGLLSFTSCSDYLDRTPDDQTTEQQVFTRFDKVESLVTDLYARAKYSLHPLIYFSHFSLSSISDECSASSHEGAIPHQFHVGNYGPSQGMPGSAGQYWDDIYYAIRNANIILEGVKNTIPRIIRKMVVKVI